MDDRMAQIVAEGRLGGDWLLSGHFLVGCKGQFVAGVRPIHRQGHSITRPAFKLRVAAAASPVT
jgi:hypothetical protein